MHSKLVFFSSAALPGDQPLWGLAQLALGALGHRPKVSFGGGVLMASILPGRVSYLVCASACNHSCGDRRDWSCWWNDNSHPCQMAAGFPGGPRSRTIPRLAHSSVRSGGYSTLCPYWGQVVAHAQATTVCCVELCTPQGISSPGHESNTTSEARLVVCQLLKTLRVWGSSWPFLLQAGQAVDGFGALALWPGRGQP